MTAEIVRENEDIAGGVVRFDQLEEFNIIR